MNKGSVNMSNYVISKVTDNHFEKDHKYKIVSSVSDAKVFIVDKYNTVVIVDLSDTSFTFIFNSEQENIVYG